MIDIKAVFKRFEDDYLKFKDIKTPGPSRPDLWAFMRLDALVPGTRDMVAVAEHDQFWLQVRPEELAAVATEEDVRDLIRCGVMYDDDIDSLSIYV